MQFEIRGAGASSGQRGCAGRLGISLFFLVFLGFGVVFGVLMGRSFLASLAMRSWTKVPCTIEASHAEHGSGASDHRAVVRYTYSWNGRPYAGDRLRPGYSGGDDASEAERLVSRYAAGTTVDCLVDPDRPEESALEPGSLLEGLMLLLPLVFAAVGLGGLVFTWRYGQGTTSDRVKQSISQEATRRFSSRGCLIPFFLLFVAVGLGLGYFLLYRPLARLVVARSWTALACVVESSTVRSHEGDDSTTYSVDIVYRYEVGGRTYRGNRYDFLGGSSSGYEAKQRVVDAHPVGTTVTCFVDPLDPASSVLQRGWSAKYLLGLLALPFFAGGLFGLWWNLGPGRRQAEVPSHRAALKGQAVVAASSPVQLKPAAGPLARTLGTLFVALFWNGITSVFVVQVVAGWRSGHGDVMLTLFMTPFVLIGLALLAAVPHQILASTNPRPRLELSSGRPRLGEIERLDWSFRGSVRRMTSLRLELEGREEATYRRGTSSATDRHVFHSEVLFASTVAAEMERGSLTFRVPATSMHSFASDHNKIVWTLKLAGEIPRWPDIAEEFTLEVQPQEEVG